MDRVEVRFQEKLRSRNFVHETSSTPFTRLAFSIMSSPRGIKSRQFQVEFNSSRAGPQTIPMDLNETLETTDSQFNLSDQTKGRGVWTSSCRVSGSGRTAFSHEAT